MSAPLAPGAYPSAFWTRLDALVAARGVQIDRPRGSRHPRYPGFVYPLDYGNLPGTQAADGGGIDVWLGVAATGVLRVTGLVCSVDLIKQDTEVKLLLDCTRDEMEAILAVHNSGEQSAILILREP